MRAVVWIPILFALAAALAIAANYSSGYVLMVVPPYRVELSLNLLIMLLIAFFFLLYWLVRLSATAIALPTKVREYRLRRRRDRARQLMFNALTTFFEGRYAKAERAAELDSRALDRGSRLDDALDGTDGHVIPSWSCSVSYFVNPVLKRPHRSNCSC